MAFLFVVYVPYTEERERKDRDHCKKKLTGVPENDALEDQSPELDADVNCKGNTSDNDSHHSADDTHCDTVTTSDRDPCCNSVDESDTESGSASRPTAGEEPSTLTIESETIKPSRSVGKFVVGPASEGKPKSGSTEALDNLKESKVGKFTVKPSGNSEVSSDGIAPSGSVQKGASVGKFTVGPATEDSLKPKEPAAEQGALKANASSAKFTVTKAPNTDEKPGEVPEGTPVDPADVTVATYDADDEKMSDMEADSHSDKEGSEDKQESDGEKDRHLSVDADNVDEPLTPLVQSTPLYKVVQQVLEDMNVENFDIQPVGNKSFWKISFVQEDSQRCEKILIKLKSKGIGHISETSISIFPSSVHVNTADNSVSPTDDESDSGRNIEAEKKETQFKKSIKSRLVVDQVVASVKSNAVFTFDYLLLLLLASMIACLGLVENSSVVLVASMLISPLMGPILAITFGQVVQRYELRNLGLKSELIGLSLCVLVGFLFGLVTGGIGLQGDKWGSSDSWPTAEMKSRGMLRSLWVGVLIALPSGAGVAISVLGGNAGSLVGVAISASLLPPACNAGMLWAYAILSSISPPAIDTDTLKTLASIAGDVTMATTLSNSTNATNATFINTTSASSPMETMMYTFPNCAPLVDNMYTPVYSCNVNLEAMILGFVSLFLTTLNIACILLMGVIVLRIKEVAPHTAGTSSINNFWQEDVKVARNYYHTTKGQQSIHLGKEFLKEWTRIKSQMKPEGETSSSSETDSSETESEDEPSPAETIAIVNYLKQTEQSSSVKDVLAKLPATSDTSGYAASLSTEYNKAAYRINRRVCRHPSVYMVDPAIQDKPARSHYNTIQAGSQRSQDPDLMAMRARFKHVSHLVPPLNIEVVNEVSPYHRPSTALQSPLHTPYKRKKPNKVKFQVSKVEEPSNNNTNA